MAEPALTVLAGPAALASLRKNGFDPESFRAMLGASGGAKWLVLGRLDRAVVARVVSGRRSPLFLLGSSIGSWRFCCYTQPDPAAALARFEDAYFAQSYSARPTPAEISAVSRGILAEILGPTGAAEALRHPSLRLSVLVARARGAMAKLRDRRLQQAGLAVAALANLLSRDLLGWFFERVLFHDPRGPLPFRLPAGFPQRAVALTENNLADAVLASGSIPGVLEPVEEIEGAPAGCYQDGGVVDYHFDYLPADDGLVLYPHFYPFLVPGWFDKMLRWRRVSGPVLDRVVLMCPSEAFVASLPGGRIPDRHDFANFDTAERLRRWRTAVDASERLAEEFLELVDTQRFGQRARPFPAERG